MHYLLGIILAIVIVVSGVWAYNETAGDRAIKEAQAYRIMTQADADAAATRAMAMAPIWLIGGSTIVGLVFGVGFVIWARNHKPIVIVREPKMPLLPGMTRVELLAAVEQYYRLQGERQTRLPIVIDGDMPPRY